MPSASLNHRLRRDWGVSVTITLRNSENVTWCTLEQHNGVSGRTFRPLQLDSISTARYRRLLESLVRQASETVGGDVLYDQLSLLPAAGETNGSSGE